MAERHTRSGDPRVAGRQRSVTAEPATGQSPALRATAARPFRPYTYRGVTGDPPEVAAARERHRDVNRVIARRRDELDAQAETIRRRLLADRAAVARLEADEAGILEDPCWNWRIEQQRREEGDGVTG